MKLWQRQGSGMPGTVAATWPMMNEEVLPVLLSGKTSVTLTADELFYMKVALSEEVRKVASFVESGDPHGVWMRELNELKRACGKIERALGRV